MILAGASLSAHAQIPVTDVGAIIQLVTEVNTLEQQLNTARQDLAQAQQQYQSMSGGRGMEQLLFSTVRKLLGQTDAAQLEAALATSKRAAVTSSLLIFTQPSALNERSSAADRSLNFSPLSRTRFRPRAVTPRCSRLLRRRHWCARVAALPRFKS